MKLDFAFGVTTQVSCLCAGIMLLFLKKKCKHSVAIYCAAWPSWDPGSRRKSWRKRDRWERVNWSWHVSSVCVPRWHEALAHMLVLPCSRPLFNHYHSLICSCHTMKNKTSKIRLNSCLCLLCFWIQDVCSVMASYFAACVYAPHAHQHAVPILLLRFLITLFYWFFSIWIISLNPTLPAPQNKTKKYHNKHTRKKNTRDTRERKKETHLHCIWICMCQVHLVCISTHLYQYDMTHLIHICEGIWSPTV